MNIMELGAIGDLIGGVAVVVGLIYVGLQVRQNTRQLKSQARYQMLQRFSDETKQLSEKESFEVLKREAPDHPFFTGDDDADRFKFLWMSWLGDHESQFYEIADGALPDDFDRNLRTRLANTFRYPRSNNLWQSLRSQHTDVFQRYIDKLLRDGFSEFPTPDAETASN